MTNKLPTVERVPNLNTIKDVDTKIIACFVFNFNEDFLVHEHVIMTVHEYYEYIRLCTLVTNDDNYESIEITGGDQFDSIETVNDCKAKSFILFVDPAHADILSIYEDSIMRSEIYSKIFDYIYSFDLTESYDEDDEEWEDELEEDDNDDGDDYKATK